MSMRRGLSLEAAVQERPYPEYADWWEMGAQFVSMMSSAILSQWKQIAGERAKLSDVRQHVEDYMNVAYGSKARSDLVDDFVKGSGQKPLFSGEFDALSYAFYRSAFELLEDRQATDEREIAEARRTFTRMVGERFFDQMVDHLALQLPTAVESAGEFEDLKNNIEIVGEFLVDQRYLRDHFAFRFDVDTVWQETRILQPPSEFVHRLRHEGLAYALYEMGYPVILPSASYLYNTIGEAQHHSSRIIEQLFDRAGLRASETADFDPTKYDANLVVELWKIRPREGS